MIDPWSEGADAQAGALSPIRLRQAPANTLKLSTVRAETTPS
jgi:hypothetical protein